MKFKINQKVFEKFPNLIVWIPVIYDFKNKVKPEFENVFNSFLREQEEKLRSEFGSVEDLLADPRISSYIETFEKFGANPKRTMPTHLALAKRVIEGNDLPDINPIVNLYNALSIKHLTPFGGENLDKVYGDEELILADGDEQFMAIGAEKSKAPKKGELVWKDAFDVCTRALNWRQCERTKADESIQDAYFIMDGFSDVNDDNIKSAADELIEKVNSWFMTSGENINFEIVKLEVGNSEAKINYETIDSSEIEFQKHGKSNDLKDGIKVKKMKKIVEYIYLENSVPYKIQEELARLLLEEFGIERTASQIHLELPNDETHGDYSTNIAMQLTKELKRHEVVAPRNPREIAEKIIEKLGALNLNYIEKIEIAGPGFVNFWISQDSLVENLSKLEKSDFSDINYLSGQKIITEYTDPNPFKIFHIGHLYSNSVGESLSRLFEVCGAEIKRANFYGDVGMHVSKSIWGLIEKMKLENLSLEDLENKSLTERIQYLGGAYAHGATYFKEPEKFAVPAGSQEDKGRDPVEEMKEINYLVFVAGQEFLKENHGWEPRVDYRKFVKDGKYNLETVKEIYFKGKQWSLDYFETIYKIVDTKFDYYYPESWAGEYGLEIVQEAFEKGVFTESDGAIVFKGEKYGLHTRVFINSLGLPTYEAKDIALPLVKYQDYKYDKSYIITANEINEYYKVVLEAQKQISPIFAEKTTHLGHGVVKLPEGKMSSRTGKIVAGMDLISEVKDRVTKMMGEGDRIEKELISEISEIIAIGAIKYSFLKPKVGGDVVFDFDESLSFEGNSGPYMQYTYARCRSILRKAEEQRIDPELIDSYKYTEIEIELLRHLAKYKNEVLQATIQLSPHIVCTYLYELGQKFNKFYQNHQVLGEDIDLNESKVRLIIVSAVANTIKHGLSLLAIKVVEKM